MEPPGDDWELLDRWRDGDAAAGDRLFGRLIDGLTRFFASKLDRDVEDLVHDTFIGLLDGAGDFRRETSVRTMAFLIARRRLYDHLARRRRSPIDFATVSAADLGTSPASAAAARQEHRHLLLALRTIPIEQQVLLELAYWEDLAGPELAIVLDIPANTVRSRLSRARDALAAALARVAGSPEQLQSTLDDLAAWSSRIKAARAT